VIATPVSWLRRWLPVLLVCLAPAAARAERVLVLPASGTGVSTEIIQSTRALFVKRLAEQNVRLTVIDRERPPTDRPPAPSDVMVLGLSAGADATILLDLSRADGSTTLSVTGLGVPGGERLFQYRQATTAGPEILPSLVEMAVLTALNQPRAAPAPLGAAVPRQLFLGARAGAQIPREKAGPAQIALPGMGLFLMGEFQRLFVDIGVTHNSAEQGDSVDRGHSTTFGVGAYLPFNVEPTAPYLGATLRWQWSRYGGQGAQGFVITPTVGWSWRRKSSLGLRIEGGVFYNLYEERAVDRLIPGAAAPHRSYGFELWVATWL
jgi:hypothetical protein